MRDTIKEKVAGLIVEEMSLSLSDSKMHEMIERAIDKNFESTAYLSKSHFGNRCMDAIREEFVRQYVSKHFDEFAKAIDMDAIKNFISISAAKKFTDRM